MYQPQHPTQYYQHRLAQCRTARAAKRAREEEAAASARMNASVASALQAVPATSSFFDFPTMVSTSSFLSSSVTKPLPPLALGFDPETLVKERVQRSAELGVEAAKDLLREEQEVSHKERVQQGKDMKSKIGKLLGRLGGSDDAVNAPGAFRLEFKASGLAAGGHVLTAVADPTATEKKAAIRGKPSSTVCITLERPLEGDAQSRDDVDGALMGQWVCQALGQEGSKCGVVRDVRRAVPNATAGCAPVVCVFLRFDSVAPAFKLAERWDNKPLSSLCRQYALDTPATLRPSLEGSTIRAQFYSTSAFDSGNFAAIVV